MRGGGRGGVTRPCALRPRPEPRPSVSQERELQRELHHRLHLPAVLGGGQGRLRLQEERAGPHAAGGLPGARATGRRAGDCGCVVEPGRVVRRGAGLRRCLAVTPGGWFSAGPARLPQRGVRWASHSRVGTSGAGDWCTPWSRSGWPVPSSTPPPPVPAGRLTSGQRSRQRVPPSLEMARFIKLSPQSW